MGKRPRWYLWALAQVWKLSYLKPSTPIIGKLILAIRSKSIRPGKFNISYLPVNTEIETVNTPLPVALLEDIIRRSPHRTLIHRCTCREAKKCKNYDLHLGCMHIGAATEEEDTTVARHVSVDEAIAHLHKAVEAGLIPFMGHAAGDNTIWNVSKDRPFLTVCFCCPCCCTLLYGYKYMPAESKMNFHKLAGITILSEKDKCIGCGQCLNGCFTMAISLSDGKSVRNYDLCKGCGRCADICPQSAVKVHLGDLKSTAKELYDRIDGEVGGLPPGLPWNT